MTNEQRLQEFDEFQDRVKERDTMMEEQRKRKKDTRKVVQLTTTDAVIFALCNDGSMWGADKGGKWTRIPDIPQD